MSRSSGDRERGRVAVRPVEEGDRDALEAFVRLPWGLYRGDPHWVPPLLRDVRRMLDPRKHPFHEHSRVRLFLALRDGIPVGRIAAIHNRRHQEFHDEPVGFFGFFESDPDPPVGAALLAAAGDWLRDRGLRVLRGPTSFSTNETAGLLVEGFDGPPMLMMPYNPPWYADLLEANGFRPAKDLLAYLLTDNEPPDYLVRGASLVERRTGATVRPLRKDRFQEELETVRRIYNAAWERNWGFVPMTDAELEHMAAELEPILDPNLCLFAELPSGETIGFVLALPDFNQVLRRLDGRLFPFGWAKALWLSRRITSLRVITLGVVEGHRRRGIDALLIRELIRHGAARGITRGELSWVLEDNRPMRAALERLGGRVYRRYRLYDAPLDGPSLEGAGAERAPLHARPETPGG